MERKQFLRSLGAGAAFAIVFPCVQGCSKDGNGDVSPEDMRPKIERDITIRWSPLPLSFAPRGGEFDP